MICSFKPIIDKNCKILILGTMPGVASLVKQQYYGHERNAFWRIIFSLFNQELTTDYSKKKAFLLQHNVALWDVLRSCEREGSSDSNIKNSVPNNFSKLFKEHQNIRAIYFNGQPAESLFRSNVLKNLDINLPFYRLPSTSPANTMKYELKFEQWKQILNELNA